MAIIGINDQTGLGGVSEANTANQRMMDYAAVMHTAGASEEVFRFGVYVTTATGDGTGVTVALYDVTSGTSGASLVAQGTISTISGSSWNTVEITPVSLTEGHTYAVAWKVNSATNVALARVYTANGCSNETLTGSSSFPSSWTDSGTLNQRYGVYAETQASSGSSSPQNRGRLIGTIGQGNGFGYVRF